MPRTGFHRLKPIWRAGWRDLQLDDELRDAGQQISFDEMQGAIERPRRRDQGIRPRYLA